MSPNCHSHHRAAILLLLLIPLALANTHHSLLSPADVYSQLSALLAPFVGDVPLFEKMAPRVEEDGASQGRLDLSSQDHFRSRSIVGKLGEVANVLFKPPNYRERRRRESDSNSYSAEQGKDQIAKLIEIEEKERVRALKRQLDEAQEYNRFLIMKHGTEEVHNLEEKGLIDLSKLVDYADAEKVFEMHGNDMLYESGNDRMHPAVTLMDLHDLSEEEPATVNSQSEASGVTQNFEGSVCHEDDSFKRMLSSKIIINTMAPKSQPNLKPYSYNAKDDLPYNRTKAYLPNQHPNIKPNLTLFTLDEKYPPQLDTEVACKNGAGVLFLTQKIFECRQTETTPLGAWTRVTEETHKAMKTYQYYSERFECRDKLEMNKVCLCPSGYSDYLCETQQQRKSYIQITEPNMAQGCTGEDSFDYVYSIKGFDPCFEFNFDEEFELKYKIILYDVNRRGEVIRGGHPEGLGFNYSNVVSNVTLDNQKIKYFATNPETGVKLMQGNSLTLQFMFQDWLYLSQNISVQTIITNNDVLLGTKEGTLRIPFPDLVASDKAGASKYEVGGRVYFETYVKAPMFSSFVTNGFFDRQGYVEPEREIHNFPVVLYVILPITCIILLVFCICYCRKQHKIKVENEKLENLQRKKQQESLLRSRQQSQRSAPGPAAAGAATQ